MSTASSDTSSEGELRNDLPCMRCLQHATQDDAFIAPNNFCVFIAGSRCDYCNGRKDNLCRRVPNLYQREVSEILNLVDFIHADGTPEELKGTAINEVKRLGELLKKDWCVLNRRIRTGQYSWAEVQGFGVDGYTKEEVESFARKASTSGRDINGKGDDDESDGLRASQRNANHTDGLVDQSSILVSEPLPTHAGFTEAVSKMAEAVDSVNGSVMSMTDSMKMSHRDIGDLLEENVRLQHKMLQAQKDMTGAIKQVVKEQKKIKVELRNWMESENATTRRSSGRQLASPKVHEGEAPLRGASRIVNGNDGPSRMSGRTFSSGEAKESGGSSKDRSALPQSALKRRRTPHSSSDSPGVPFNKRQYTDDETN